MFLRTGYSQIMIKLNPATIHLIAKYFTAANVGTMPQDLYTVSSGNVPTPENDLKRYCTLYYILAEDNHNCEGISLTSELRWWTREVSKNPQKWAEEFTKEFGADAVDRIQ